ncbi:MAG: glycosyltransferase family 39 protein [Clostridiales bacterium]|nr:glycosyltransferase family 39 protein [Clostridiales bacterium]
MEKSLIGKMSKHPYILLALSAVVAYLTTGGSLGVMPETGVFLCLIYGGAVSGVFTGCICNKKAPVTAAYSAVLALLGISVYLTYHAFGYPELTLMAGGLIMLFCSAIILKVNGKINSETLIFLLVAAGFWIRLGRVLTTPLGGVYQHDVQYFTNDMQSMAHDTYILWFRDHWLLPDFDIREFGEFYHPPLHYFLSGMFLRFNSLIFPALADNYHCIKILTLFYSSAGSLVLIKILKELGVKDGALTNGAMLAVFFPGFTLIASSVNNDILSILLSLLSLYFALVWYRKPSMKKIVFTGLAIGLAMMSKLSAGFMAFPVGFLFLTGFIRSKTKKDIFKEFLVFALMTFPLGLWFPLRNYIRWGVPFTFVHELDNPVQSLEKFSTFDRLFTNDPVASVFPYVILNEKEQDYNIFRVLLKTALFDERQHLNNSFDLLYGTVILNLLRILLLIMLAGMVIAVIRAVKKKEKAAETAFSGIIFAVMLVSFVLFCLKYQVFCSMNFRYVVPLLVPFIYFVSTAYSAAEDKKQRLIKGLITVIVSTFCVLSAIFVMTTWIKR